MLGLYVRELDSPLSFESDADELLSRVFGVADEDVEGDGELEFVFEEEEEELEELEEEEREGDWAEGVYVVAREDEEGEEGEEEGEE